MESLVCKGSRLMARKRMIDPSFWADDKIIELKPLSRLCFIGLWNFSDDTGVHRNSCKMIKAEIFPADDIPVSEIEDVMSDLIKHRLIEVSEDEYLIRIRNWKVHQKISHPGASKYEFSSNSSNNSLSLVEPSSNISLSLDRNISQVKSSKDNKVKEAIVQKPKEASGPKPYEVRVDEFFNKITDKYKAQLKEAYPNADIEAELKKSKIWLLSNTHKAKKQFKKFINGWMGRAMENASYAKKAPESPAYVQAAEEKRIKAEAKQKEYFDKAKENAASQDDIKEALADGMNDTMLSYKDKHKRRLNAIKDAKN